MSGLDIFDASYDLRDLSPKQKAAVVRLMEITIEETKAEINKLLNEPLRKWGIDVDSHPTIESKIEILLSYP